MYSGRVFIRETSWVCGDYIDADIYPVFQPPGKRRSKCRPTGEAQARLNQRNAERALTRQVHLNFGRGDIAIHLTYAVDPEDPARARKDLTNFLNRVKRLRRKLGLPELKYVSCTEIGGSGRVHHHVIMSGGVDRDVLERAWGKGYANTKRLQFGEDGVTGLARYVAKGKHFYRRWNRSRNLEKPVATVRETTHAELAAAVRSITGKNAHGHFEGLRPGWSLTHAVCVKNPHNRGDYVRYEMRRVRKE